MRGIVEKRLQNTSMSRKRNSKELEDVWERSRVIKRETEELEPVKRDIYEMGEAIHSKFEARLFPVISAQVRELMNEFCHNLDSRLVHHHASSSASRTFKLNFVGSLPNTLYTQTDIKDHGTPLQVELQDCSGFRLQVGPEASSRIKILVLQGSLNDDETDDWTPEDFDRKVVNPRSHKGQLLKGNSDFCLRDGVVSIGGVAFTDNSSFMRSGTFRFGARVVKSPPGVYIREAVTQAFRVKERRTISYRSHPLKLEDSVGSLRLIQPIHCQRLASARIHTVKDFLQQYHTDLNMLKKVLDVTNSAWSTIVNDAKSCSLTEGGYVYNDEASAVDLELDCVFNIVRITVNGIDQGLYKHLPDSQKEVANNIRLVAYEKRNELRRIHIPTGENFGNCGVLGEGDTSRSTSIQACEGETTEPALLSLMPSEPGIPADQSPHL